MLRAPTAQARVISIITQTQQFVKRKIRKKINKLFSQKVLTNQACRAIIQIQSKEVITMVTDAELVFWCVVGVLCVLFVCAMPFINNYIAYKETEKMFANR